MRNLKRALSLALASVMLLGMMVVGTSAVSYPDVDEKDNVEAIEVLNAVKVMIGDRGNFRPDAKVNRHEMAVIMAKLVLGNEAADNYVGSHPFTDVFPWADKYVAACYENGLVSGTSATTYGGNNPLTAVQAAAMMLRALGYKDLSKGATDWRAPVTAMANQIRLFNGVASNPKEELNRNQVAQLALNTLKSPVVTLKDNTFDVTSGDGQVVISGGSREYIVRSSSEDYAYAINQTEFSGSSAAGIHGATVELGEHLYNGKLTLREDNSAGWDVSDAFGRPARHWEYDGKEIGTYAKYESMRHEYTTKVTGKMLYDLLGKEVVDHYDINITIDGETTYSVLNGHGYFSNASMTRTNTDAVGATGNGVLTQVFVDGVNKTVDIAIINTYLAKARQDYNSRDNDVDLTVYKIDDSTESVNCGKYAKTANKSETMTVEGEDFAIEDVKEDDLFLVTVAEGEIKTMVKPEILSETTINAFKQGSWVKTADAQYDYATTAQYDAEVLDMYSNTNMKDVTYNVILDKYGYLVGLELNEQPNQYLFLTGLDLGGSNISAQSAQANVIFLDGTMKTVTVDTSNSEAASTATASDNTITGYTVTGGDDNFNHAIGGGSWAQANTWCTYTVNSEGVYTLKQIGNFAGAASATPYVRGAKKVAQSTMDADLMLKASGDTPENKQIIINSKNVALEGSKKRNDTTYGDFDYVYGDEKTVYINVDMKDVTCKDTYTRAIVDKVSSFATGVKNVDIAVKDLSTHSPALTSAPSAEAYVLYNNKGNVIAAVTLAAEDNGSSSSWAYITSTVNQEEYLGGSDWRWSKDAIINGKAVKLTEKRDDYKYLKDSVTVVGNWYEVRFDADGNVTKLVPNNDPAIPNRIDFSVADDKFITDVEDVRLATNGITPYTKSNSSLLLYSDFTCGTAPHTSGDNRANLRFDRARGTLYTSTGTSKGFTVDSNVKVVLCLSAKHGADAFDKVIDTYENWDGLEDALKALDCDQTAFDGYLSAIFSNGRATSIILDDRSGSHTTVNENAPKMTVKVTKVGTDGTSLGVQTIQWDGTAFDGSEVTNPAGYTWVSATPLTFKEKGEGETTFTYTKNAPAKVTKANASAITGVDADVRTDLINCGKGARVTADGDDLIVTGTLNKSDGNAKTWFNSPAYDYFLPLVFQAPENSGAVSMDLSRNGAAAKNIALTGGKETVVVGLDKDETAVEFEIKWKKANGDVISTTNMIVDLSGVTYATTGVEATIRYKVGTTVVATEPQKVELDINESYVFSGDDNVIANKIAANNNISTNYDVTAGQSIFVEANTTYVDVNVTWKTVELKLGAAGTTGDMIVSWTAEPAKGIAGPTGGKVDFSAGTAVDVPRGVELTITGDKVGKYDQNGEQCTTMTLTGNKTLAATDFGYYKVSLGAAPTLTGWGVTQSIKADAAYKIKDGAAVVKKGTATNVIIEVVLTPDGGSKEIADTEAVTAALDGSPTGITLGAASGFPADTASDGNPTEITTAQTATQTISANISADTEVGLTLTEG